ncbi:MAG: hypothetical protein HOI56_00735 [Gammaproteobacteria bacterium]|nr:hypothetical protein [Gammaproteobacteria bacterium]MBT5761252.1 hypothetical protein [Gammaproteobacteria bacterium]MBT7323387.1 hypothetical protein [Gammaproteobacteria bacterium]MDG2158561.1 hypothetical protein [Gammaproteobacteria bacterium]
MRYLINAKDKSINPSEYIVDGTVVFTLITGIIFLYFGMKFKKIWIKFWGVLTIISCFLYFVYS